MLYNYKIAWAFAQASEQVLQFVTEMEDVVTALTKKKKGKMVDKLRESVS